MVQGMSEILQTTWSAVQVSSHRRLTFDTIEAGSDSVKANGQASISVILVLLYGYLARAYGLLTEQGESVSSFPVRSKVR